MADRGRLLRRCGAVLAAAGLAAVCAAPLLRQGPPEVAAETTVPAAVPARPVAAAPGPLPRSAPARIVIPRLGVDARITGAGLTDEGTAPVPAYDRPQDVTWFSPGPAPGQRGPAVLLGHVDDRDGPAVFYDLARLRPGDAVEVTRRDRTTAVFTVQTVTRTPKAKFPTERVYGDRPSPELRLITCGGPFDAESRSYRDNTIVFARLSGHRAQPGAGRQESSRHAAQPPR